MANKLVKLYWKLVPYDYCPGELLYKAKCFFWHRYTTVKPRYLGHTWVDRDDLLAHAMFEILSQFIEKECSPGHVDWEWDEVHRTARAELQELYDWWNGYYNHQLEKDQETLWAIVEKHSPTNYWKDIDDKYMEWKPSWPTPEDKIIYNNYMNAINALDEQVQVTLKLKMHKLIELSHWMWT